MNKNLDAACRIYLTPLIARYLLVHQEGRLDGVEKATRHREMCQFYVAVHRGLSDPDLIPVTDALYNNIHEDTRALTDYLDESIGFPLVGQPDYDRLVPLFFERFHSLALFCLSHYKEE